MKNTWFAVFSLLGSMQEVQAAQPPKEIKMPTLYAAKDFSYLLGKGSLDDELLKMHFTLYEGYVKNVNLLQDLFHRYTAKETAYDYSFQALKRRFAFEFDGMRLHELYFENIGGNKPLSTTSALYQNIVQAYGSFEAWKEDFIACALMRGVGWVALYFDPIAKRFVNSWINEHETGHLVLGEILLLLDVWEHSYLTQFKLDRKSYIEAFFRMIDWELVERRLQKTLKR